jgi:hypothetical protein
MKPYQLALPLLLLLVTCSEALPPSTATTRVSSAEVPIPAPAIKQVDPPEAQAELERRALQRQLDIERRFWTENEAARNERDAAVVAVWRRFEVADGALAQMRARLDKMPPAERSALTQRIVAADAARATVERRMHQIMGGGEWPEAKTDLAKAIDDFEEAVR